MSRLHVVDCRPGSSSWQLFAAAVEPGDQVLLLGDSVAVDTELPANVQLAHLAEHAEQLAVAGVGAAWCMDDFVAAAARRPVLSWHRN